ncbi:MAG: hypothetical protein ACTS2F_07085 [Thainema sp.]
MTTEEQLENWLEPFRQDPQTIVDNCWQHAELYSSSNPIPHSSICTYIVNYDFKGWRFLNALSKGDSHVWKNLLPILLLFIVLLVAIVLIESTLQSKNKK